MDRDWCQRVAQSFEDQGGSFGESGGAPARRIPSGHDFDPRALKPMAQTLWATSISLGHALTAFRHLSRLKSATVSPDGMMGGRGFVMSMKEARKRLFDACESLSSIADTIHDEIQAPHWKSKLSQLDETDVKDVKRFVEESEKFLDNPEETVAEEEEAIQGHPSDESEEEPEGGSRVPNGGGPAAAEVADVPRPRVKQADSSVAPETLPGPRVTNLSRGESDQTGPLGSFNVEERYPSDDWTALRREYDYPGAWECDFSHTASSGLPADSETKTDAWDWGLGFGAKGQGAGGYANPSDEGSPKSVWGPHAGLPGGAQTPVGDSTKQVDVALNGRREAANAVLPNDPEEPVARTDYFKGWKGNMMQAQIAESNLPSEVAPVVNQDVSMIDTFFVSEDVSTPFVRFDNSTHTYRRDPIHNWPKDKS